MQFDHEGQDEYLKEYKDVLVDCMVPNVEEEKRSIFFSKDEYAKLQMRR